MDCDYTNLAKFIDLPKFSQSTDAIYINSVRYLTEFIEFASVKKNSIINKLDRLVVFVIIQPVD